MGSVIKLNSSVFTCLIMLFFIYFQDDCLSEMVSQKIADSENRFVDESELVLGRFDILYIYEILCYMPMDVKLK